jgi:MEMO1 family protein
MIRPPAVAGTFYSLDARELARQISGFTNAATAAPSAAAPPKIPARGCVVPHAGYMYSGHIAGAVYAAIEIPARCILLGPRHFPRGEALAILTEGSFATPLGEAGACV